MRKTPGRKRPCRICRRWFLPDPRLKGRQMTCGDAHCKRQWHRKKCQEWNRKNSDYFRSNYLHKKLDALSGDEKATQTLPPKSSCQHLIIIEYFAQLLMRRFQEALRGQPIVNTGKLSRLPGVVFSRRDGL